MSRSLDNHQRWLKSRIGPIRFVSLLLIAGFAAQASAQTPSPVIDPQSVEKRLRNQDEMIRRLTEQNRALGQQLDSISQRLGTQTISNAARPGVDEVSLASPAPDTGTALTPAKAPEVSAPSDGRRAESSDLYDSLHRSDDYGFKSLFDSLHAKGKKGKSWYEKLSLRGYTQVRFGRTLHDRGAETTLLGDSSINGRTEDFSIRRARLILSGDVSDHMYLYFQSDFSNTPPESTGTTFYAQVRDLYADVYLDTDKVNRFRIGQSKTPYGFDNMQSSGNRIPIDRTESMDSAVFPNQRDLGAYYYWTPVEKQRLLRDLVDGGLKGSGNYGIFALGVNNGQGGGLLEKNRSPHLVSRFTWPFQLSNGQVVEVSLQGYTGRYVVNGAPISPLGVGPLIVPAGTDQSGNRGIRDQRIAATFVYYPQPFGFQAEWNVGRGPGLNGAQTAVEERSVSGGYVMTTYKMDTARFGVITPYARYQNYHGGYRAIENSPYGTHSEWSLGAEWQIRREMELVMEYGFANGVSLDAISDPGVRSYQGYRADIFRMQFQFNY